MNVRTAAARIIRSEVDRWTWGFAHTIAVLPPAVLDGRLTEEILDEYPVDASYPVQLSRAIAHQIGEVMVDESDDPNQIVVSAEDIGVAIEVLHALRVGDVGVIEHEVEDGSHTVMFYQDNVEAHGMTGEQVREYVTGMSWTEAARLVVEAHAVPLDEAQPRTIVRTGGFVSRWYRPGDYTDGFGRLDDGQYGMGLAGGVTDLVGEPAELAEFGERVAMRWPVGPVMTALTELTEVIDRQLAVGNGDMFAGLPCDVADALAKVLARAGSTDTAVGLLAGHATADDEPEYDRHTDISEAALVDEAAAHTSRRRLGAAHQPGAPIAYTLRTAATDRYLHDLASTD